MTETNHKNQKRRGLISILMVALLLVTTLTYRTAYATEEADDPGIGSTAPDSVESGDIDSGDTEPVQPEAGNFMARTGGDPATVADYGALVAALADNSIPIITISNDFQLDATCNISRTVTIISDGSTLTVASGRHFNLTSGADLTLAGVTLEGGAGKGGVYVANATLTLTDSAIKNCAYSTSLNTYGGAIQASSSTVNLNGTAIFSGNSARYGGVIYTSTCTTNISDDIIFTNNTAMSGGVIYCYNSVALNISGNVSFADNNASVYGTIYSSGAALNISGNVSFIGNTTPSYGGAVYAYQGTVSISGSVRFESNTSNLYGGAIVLNCITGTATISGNVSFVDNNVILGGVSQNGGGAIHVEQTNLAISDNVRFEGNTSDTRGGAIHSLSLYHDNISLSISDGVSFTGNSTSGNGGAIYISGTIFSISGNVHFEGNTADVYGGAIYTNNKSFTISDNVSFTGNSAQHNGGAILVDTSGNLAISGGVSFTGNTAGKYGGAIDMDGGDLAIVGDARFTGNSSDLEGGAIAMFGGNISIDGDAHFTGNSTQYSGGVICSYQGDISIDGKARFANNSAENGGAICTYNPANLTFSGATFTGNTASALYKISDPILIAIHDAQITGCTFSFDLPYGYNNYDIYYSGTDDEKAFIVYYDTNGGSPAEIAPKAVLWDDTNLLPTEPARTGYTFGGWNVTDNSSGTDVCTNVSADAAYSELALDDTLSSITLTVQWNVIPPPITPTTPTPEPPTSPTPSEAPTAEPTDEPTTDPTTEPTTEPTDNLPTETTADPSTEPTEDSTGEPATPPTTIIVPGTPDVLPAPAVEGGTIVVDDDGMLIEIGDDGTPLGTWHYDEDVEAWIFDPIIPLGVIPVTGDAGYAMWLAAFLLAVSGCTAAVVVRRRTGKAR